MKVFLTIDLKYENLRICRPIFKILIISISKHILIIQKVENKIEYLTRSISIIFAEISFSINDLTTVANTKALIIKPLVEKSF